MAAKSYCDPTLKHHSPILRDGFISMAIIGKSGCGKTKFIESILPHFSENIKTIIIATVIHHIPLHEAIIKYAKSHGKHAGVSYDPEELRHYVDISEQIGNVNMQKQGLMIFDDFNDGRTHGPYWDFAIHAFSKLRNVGWNFIIVSQYPTFIPPIIRNNTTCRVFFDCYSDSAIRTFTTDLRSRVHEPGILTTLFDYIRTVPYTYLLIQDRPFTISAGALDNSKLVIKEGDVIIPTYNDMLREMGVGSKKELDDKTAYLQGRAGNTSHRLGQYAHMPAPEIKRNSSREFDDSDDGDDEFEFNS